MRATPFGAEPEDHPLSFTSCGETSLPKQAAACRCARSASSRARSVSRQACTEGIRRRRVSMWRRYSSSSRAMEGSGSRDCPPRIHSPTRSNTVSSAASCSGVTLIPPPVSPIACRRRRSSRLESRKLSAIPGIMPSNSMVHVPMATAAWSRWSHQLARRWTAAAPLRPTRRATSTATRSVRG